MTSFTKSRTIQAPANRLWEILADFGGVYLFHPLVESSPITNGRGTGLGAARTCHLYNGAEVAEEITSFDPERRHLAITVRDPSGPIQSMGGEFTVTPINDVSCEVTAVMEYSLKGGVIGKAVDALLFRRMMERTIENVLEGLDDHAVTGAVIGEGGKHLSAPSGAVVGA